MRRNHFEDNLLYVVDGELLNHMVRILRKFKEIRPEHKQVLNIMRRNNITMEACLNTAYNDIKDRKGRMVDGVFVKEEDLE